MLYHRRKLLQVCSESSIPEIRKIGKFLENIPNICYSPLGWPVARGNLGGGWCGLGPVVFPFYLYCAVVVVGSLGWCLVVRVWWRCCEAAVWCWGMEVMNSWGYWGLCVMADAT